MELLFRVSDAFQISGRGCVIAGDAFSASWRVGDEILLRTPAGQDIPTHVRGLEIVCGPNVRRDHVAILLPEEITKEDVPPGTEVWLTKKSPQEVASQK